MKAVVQRVTRASVQVDEHICGEIGNGLVVYLGVHEDDTDQDASYIARKIAQLRIFTDEQGKMNRSVCDLSGGILLISQFTLCANTRKGTGPPSTKPWLLRRLSGSITRWRRYSYQITNLRFQGVYSEPIC